MYVHQRELFQQIQLGLSIPYADQIQMKSEFYNNYDTYLCVYFIYYKAIVKNVLVSYEYVSIK